MWKERGGHEEKNEGTSSAGRDEEEEGIGTFLEWGENVRRRGRANEWNESRSNDAVFTSGKNTNLNINKNSI